MKITKTKEVVTEEIEVELGTYYFECQEGLIYKMILTEYDDDGIDYFLEEVSSWGSPYGIRVRKDTIFEEEEVPYIFSAFIRGISGEKITKEMYEQEREETLKRIIEDDKVTFAQ